MPGGTARVIVTVTRPPGVPHAEGLAFRAMTAATATVDHTPPTGPSGTLGVRNLLRFVRGQLPWLTGLADKHGDLVRMKMLGTWWFIVSHPDDIERMLVKDARVMQRDAGIDIVRRVLGHGLLTSEGDLWKRQRKLMSQAFTPKRIADYATAMVRVGDVALRRWRDGATTNLHQEMSRLTMEVVADVLFGASMSTADVEAVGGAMEIANEFFSGSPEAMLKIPKWVPTPRNIRMNRAVATLDRVVYEIIAHRRAGEPKGDLLGTLLAARDDDGAGMSDGQLRDEVMTLFLAGHETTSLALAHALYLLSLNPAIERRLHDEIVSVLGGRLPTADDARSLHDSGTGDVGARGYDAHHFHSPDSPSCPLFRCTLTPTCTSTGHVTGMVSVGSVVMDGQYVVDVHSVTYATSSRAAFCAADLTTLITIRIVDLRANGDFEESSQWVMHNHAASRT